MAVSGEVLHRGSLKNLLTPNETLLRGLAGVASWGQKIVNLLQQHRIGLFGGNAHFVCVLADKNAAVSIAIAESPL